MTTKERSKYFGELWPAACAAAGWNSKDNGIRNGVTAECMRAVRGPDVASTSLLEADEITALFCYLEFLAHPDDLDRSARWVSCQEDYRAYNRARQADWHERKLYGPGKNKLDRDRFQGETKAARGPLDTLNSKEVSKRHITFASRHQKKQREEVKALRALGPGKLQALCIETARAIPAISQDIDPAYATERLLGKLSRAVGCCRFDQLGVNRLVGLLLKLRERVAGRGQDLASQPEAIQVEEPAVADQIDQEVPF